MGTPLWNGLSAGGICASESFRKGSVQGIGAFMGVSIAHDMGAALREGTARARGLDAAAERERCNLLVLRRFASAGEGVGGGVVARGGAGAGAKAGAGGGGCASDTTCGLCAVTAGACSSPGRVHALRAADMSDTLRLRRREWGVLDNQSSS